MKILIECENEDVFVLLHLVIMIPISCYNDTDKYQIQISIQIYFIQIREDIMRYKHKDVNSLSSEQIVHYQCADKINPPPQSLMTIKTMDRSILKSV